MDMTFTEDDIAIGVDATIRYEQPVFDERLLPTSSVEV